MLVAAAACRARSRSCESWLEVTLRASSVYTSAPNSTSASATTAAPNKASRNRSDNDYSRSRSA